MSTSANVLEHGDSKPARYLRVHRFRITLWIAADEGLLVLLQRDPAPRGLRPRDRRGRVLVPGRPASTSSATARQVSWIFAASQAIAVLVPIVLTIAKWAAIVAIAITAVVALVILFAERERL